MTRNLQRRHWIVRLWQDGPSWGDIAKTTAVLAVLGVIALALRDAGIVGRPDVQPTPRPTVSSSVPPWVKPPTDGPSATPEPGIAVDTDSSLLGEPDAEDETPTVEDEEPREVRRTVHPGAFCSAGNEGEFGWTERGVRMECRRKTGDDYLRWRRAD